MKSIAVIYGSDSSEWEVSVRSGEFTASQLDGSKYDVYEVFARFGHWTLKAYRRGGGERVLIPECERPQICKCDFSVSLEGEKIKFDYKLAEPREPFNAEDRERIRASLAELGVW